MSQRIAEYLLGLEIFRLGRANLMSKDAQVPSVGPLSDNLVFIVEHQRYFELFTDQANTKLLELPSLSELFVDYEIEPDYTLVFQQINSLGDVRLPSSVGRVVEYWQSYPSEPDYLLGIVLMNCRGIAIVSVCVETDEAEVLSYCEFMSRMKATELHYGNVKRIYYSL